MTRGKTALLIVMLLGSSYYGYSKYKALTPSPAINNGVNGEFVVRRMDDSEEGKKRREEFAKQLNLTPEQQEAMKKMREQMADGERGRGRWTSMTAILTPQQRAQMAAARDARRDKGAKAALNKGDFEKYKAKRDQMRGNRGPRSGRGPQGPR